MESGSLCALLWTILSWCTRKQVTLKARHIPGRLNMIADKLSRLGQTIQTDWSLHPEVFQAICFRWHQPQVDLFATKFNNKLTQFVSLVPDPQAWAVDPQAQGQGKGIPSWNLSLVLHQLTKAPFEPLKKASLKHLTFKTVFLLALGSGKRRSEIHAWLHKNIRHQSDWSKVSLYPSPGFLSKNQLAKEGPDSVAPVVSVQLEPFAITWIGPQILGRTRSWSLSPSRKVLIRTSHLPPSPHGSSRL